MRILYLDLDTLRPDHLGCYGYHRNTSPNLDKIAAEGVRFDNYFCSDAPCLPSRTALMTGRFGIHSGVVGHGGTAADLRLEGATRSFRDRLGLEDSFPTLLRKAGLKTTLISPFAERHSAWHYYAGFSEMHNPGKCGNESAEEVTPLVLKWLEQNAKEDNWYLHINYWDPHTPYRVPTEYGNPFADAPLPEWLTPDVLAEHRKLVGPHSAHEYNMYDNQESPQYPRQPGEIKDMEDLRRAIDGYDCGIRYMDDHIGILLDALEKQGVLEDLIILVSADHGENMGELGIYGEHGTADYINTRIPMIIKHPHGQKGHVDSGLHYNLDLGPTFAELLQLSPSPRWDGQSFAPAIVTGADCGREYLVVSQCAHVAQRGVRFGDWMYIRTYHDGYHLFPDEMLFHIAEDPHEQYDLAEKRKDICKEAVYYLNQWHDDMMKSMDYDVDPLWTVIKEGGPFHANGHLPRYIERLKETGRDFAIDELKRRHSKEFQ